MPELTAENLIRAALGLLTALAVSFGSVSTNQAHDCRDLLQDERAAQQTREIRDSDLCGDAIEAVRDVCRERR